MGIFYWEKAFHAFAPSEKFSCYAPDFHRGELTASVSEPGLVSPSLQGQSPSTLGVESESIRPESESKSIGPESWVQVQWVRVRVQQKSEWVRTLDSLSPTLEKCFILTLLVIFFAEWQVVGLYIDYWYGSLPKFPSLFFFFLYRYSREINCRKGNK